MAKFKKGKSGNPKGRPLGTKNKNYADVSHWLMRADFELETEPDRRRKMAIIKWATQLIMQKIPVLPATPGDSLSNAIAAQTLVKALESDTADTDPAPAVRGG